MRMPSAFGLAALAAYLMLSGLISLLSFFALPDFDLSLLAIATGLLLLIGKPT